MAFRKPYHRNNRKNLKSSNFSFSLPILVIFLLVINNDILDITQSKISTHQNAQNKESARFDPFPQIRIFKYKGSVSEYSKLNELKPKVKWIRFSYIDKKYYKGLTGLYNTDLKTDFSSQGSHSSFSPSILVPNTPVISHILLNEYIYSDFHAKRLEKYTSQNCIPKTSIYMSTLDYTNYSCDHQRLDNNRYVKNANFHPNDIKRSMIDRITGVFGSLFDIINVILQSVGLWFNNTVRYIFNCQVQSYAYRSYNNHSELHLVDMNSAFSPGNMIQPSKVIMAVSCLMMLSSASTSASALAVGPSAPISEEDLNKYKVIHMLNTEGTRALQLVYKYFKRFPDSKSIKDHLIDDLRFSEYDIRKMLNSTMIDVITSSGNSGEAYDITLLIKCIRVLSEQYEPNSKAQKKWKDEGALECRCQKLADKRNTVFHSFSGLTNSKMIKELNAIENLIIDILTSLKLRFPIKSIEIDRIKIDIHDRKCDILTYPLGETEIRKCLFQKRLKFLRDAIPSYKTNCKKDWGKLNILDFLLDSKTTHDVKQLFTDIVIKQSNKFNKNASIDYKEIMKNLSPLSILLIESENGGGKSTLFRYGINDWGEGGPIMKTSGYDYIFPMIFRNPHICSIKELIVKLIPSVVVNIGIENIMDLLADPSLSILFYCDGFDEKNSNSRKLFDEICHLKEKYHNIKVIITSRPESVKEFYYFLTRTSFVIDHIMILGVPENKRSEFLRNYHEEFIKSGLSKQNTDKLLQFYSSCSARHRDLYRLPLNLVILAYLWGKDPNKVKNIKSAAGLYTAITKLSNEKLIGRIVQSYPDVMSKIDWDLAELSEMIDRFKEKLYSESLAALRSDRIYIDENGTKILRNLCKEIGLPYKEMIGAFLLSKVDNDTFMETLEVAHKGFLDFFAAKCIEVMLAKGRGSIKSILLELCGENYKTHDLKKFQVTLQLLGGLLALRDDNLVEMYGQEIINLLVETGISNNSQWYDVFSDVNTNPIAAEKYARLIAPHLKDNDFHARLITPHLEDKDFHINDAEVEVVTTLIPYIDINKVTLNISGTVMHDKLFSLMNVLRDEICSLGISKIEDEQINLWNSILTPHDKIEISKVTLKNSYNILPLHSNQNTIVSYYLEQYWKRLVGPAPDMSKVLVRRLWTAVETTDRLPPTVEVLRLGLLIDPATGRACDPGITQLTLRCKRLTTLGVHVRAGTATEHLPNMPNLKYSHLYLSQLKSNSDICWAAKTAKTLKPTRRSYMRLILPSCELNVDQLKHLVLLLKQEGVTIKNKGGVYIQSTLPNWQCRNLKAYTLSTLKCDLYRYLNDGELSCCKFCSW